MAAYLARRSFGCSAQDIARALGYRSHGSVRNAILRAERGNDHLQRRIRTLQTNLANVLTAL